MRDPWLRPSPRARAACVGDPGSSLGTTILLPAPARTNAARAGDPRFIGSSICSKEFFLFGPAALWDSFTARPPSHSAIRFASVTSIILLRRSNRPADYEFGKRTGPGFFYLLIGRTRSVSLGLAFSRSLRRNLQGGTLARRLFDVDGYRLRQKNGPDANLLASAVQRLSQLGLRGFAVGNRRSRSPSGGE